MKPGLLVLWGLVIGLGVITSEAQTGTPTATHPAAKFRAAGEPVTPAPDGTIFCEAKEFKVESPGWQARSWGENYYAATMANTFLSRKAFLGAPEQCEKESVATINVQVKEAGKYLVLVRYEAVYRFETQFTVKVEQAGKVIVDRLYGARKNPKIWAFGNKIKDEVAWTWGAGENVVWEGHDAYAELQPGPAKIKLIAGKQVGDAARRNVDLVMLTRDEAQVKMRIDKEGYLPLDGMLTQAGDVFMKVSNAGTAKVTVKSLEFAGGPMQQHSPYWVHLRDWKPIAVEVEPGRTTDWIDVGGTMDTLNDGQWGFSSTAKCRLEFGVKNAAGAIKSVRTLDCDGKLPLVSWADMRYTPRIQTSAEATQELLDYVKKLPPHGKKITQTQVVAMGALPREFYELYGIKLSVNGTGMYDDCRDKSLAQLRETYGKMSEAERRRILIMSLGDEIGLPQPDAKAAQEGFVTYLKSQGVSAQDVDPGSGGDWARIKYTADEKSKTDRPGLYYWSQRYLYQYGIQTIKERTDLLHSLLPNAHIGANFSPHHGGGEYSYLGETFKWVTCFRENGMTLPWSEDYIWQVPVGTPQMNGIGLDLFRAGLRGRPERKIMYYVMPHAPGNTPAMWRRLFHNAVGHGAKMFNLFEFNPVWIAYTENHVTGKEMYAEVFRSLRELGLYEDIVQSGAVRPAQAALWFSECGDIWRDNTPSFGAAKRALYVATLGQQVPLDIVVEQDTTNGTLNQYKVLYLTDNHVSRAASVKIAEWVNAGGRLFATAGAGMFDEYNQPNKTMRALLGVEQSKLEMPADQQVHFIKQDLRHVKPLGEVTLVQSTTFPVFGVVSTITKGADTEVRGTFADGTPAVVTRKAGKGQVVYCAFLPGLSYFHPAIPRRPLDRGASDDAMSQFMPTDFNVTVGRLVAQIVPQEIRPLQACAANVEATIIESKVGTIITLTNWSRTPVKGLKITANIPLPTRSVTLSTGAPVKTDKAGDKTVFTLDLDIACALILR